MPKIPDNTEWDVWEFTLPDRTPKRRCMSAIGYTKPQPAYIMAASFNEDERELAKMERREVNRHFVVVKVTRSHEVVL